MNYTLFNTPHIYIFFRHILTVHPIYLPFIILGFHSPQFHRFYLLASILSVQTVITWVKNLPFFENNFSIRETVLQWVLVLQTSHIIGHFQQRRRRQQRHLPRIYSMFDIILLHNWLIPINFLVLTEVRPYPSAT